MTLAFRRDAGKVVATCHYRRRHPSAFAGVWDRFRASVCTSAAGRVLEVGAQGITDSARSPHVCYLASVCEGTSPEAVSSGNEEIVDAELESLPFPAGAFDVVVSTFALCSTPQPNRAVLELRRVLRPVGQMLFLEHTRGPGVVGTVQDRAAAMVRGTRWCRPNLDVLEELRRAGLVVRKVEWFWPRPRLHAPLVHGVASLPDRQYERELQWLRGR